MGPCSLFPSAVCLIVLGLLSYAIRRDRAPDSGALGGGGDRTAIRWIVVGTGISTVVLLGAAIWTFWAVRSVTNATTPPGLIIDVTGHQWWWEAHYRSNDPSREFTTANDLVIPVGVPVQVNLGSSDVIHSFWVPRLAGKTDTIPGVTNSTRIEADREGTYRGQCTEFCGLEHAHMAFFVVAKNQDDFNAWWDRQLQSATVDTANQGRAGLSRQVRRLSRDTGYCRPAGFSAPTSVISAAARPSAPELSRTIPKTSPTGSTILRRSNRARTCPRSTCPPTRSTP